MQPLPHVYSVTAAGGARGDVSLTAPGVEPLPIAAPPQFDGPEDRWSPESLLAAAVASCFILTFRAVARASKLPWINLDCEVDATLERIDHVTQFTRIVTRATLTVPAGTSTVQCERALSKSESSCLVTNSLRAERELQMEIIKSEDEQSVREAI